MPILFYKKEVVPFFTGGWYQFSPSLKTLNIIGLFLLIQLIQSCKEEEESAVPILTTSAVTEISGLTATSGGTVTSEGSGAVTERGVCWSTGPSPTIVDNKTSNGTGTGNFASNLTYLQMGETYNVRAYATIMRVPDMEALSHLLH